MSISEAKLITPTTVAQCDLARGFRNLIHPGRALRLQDKCTRSTALAAIGAVEAVIEDLTP
jgi:hypothetical protein